MKLDLENGSAPHDATPPALPPGPLPGWLTIPFPALPPGLPPSPLSGWLPAAHPGPVPGFPPGPLSAPSPGPPLSVQTQAPLPGPPPGPPPVSAATATHPGARHDTLFSVYGSAKGGREGGGEAAHQMAPVPAGPHGGQAAPRSSSSSPRRQREGRRVVSRSPRRPEGRRVISRSPGKQQEGGRWASRRTSAA